MFDVVFMICFTIGMYVFARVWAHWYVKALSYEREARALTDYMCEALDALAPKF